MSAKKLTITDSTGAVSGSFNVRFEKLDRAEAPEIIHKVGDIEVKNRSIHNNTVLLEGMTRKGWVDDQSKEYQTEEVRHYYEGQEVTEKAGTKTFEIIAYQSVKNYTDHYVIGKYYEVFPDDDGFKKDFQKNAAKSRNLTGMRALWEYLHTNNLVARAEFNVSSSGFLPSDGYIRAIEFGNKWTLEIGIFTEEKVFTHLQEAVVEEMPVVNRVSLKRV